DVLDVTIDLQQGDVVLSKLLEYPQSVEEKNKPFLLLQNQTNERYVANSNLFVSKGQAIQALNFNFTTPQPQYELAPEQKQLTVILNGKDNEGLDVKKEFTFTRGSYLIGVNYNIANKGSSEWTGYMNTQ